MTQSDTAGSRSPSWGHVSDLPLACAFAGCGMNGPRTGRPGVMCQRALARAGQLLFHPEPSLQEEWPSLLARTASCVP